MDWNKKIVYVIFYFKKVCFKKYRIYFHFVTLLSDIWINKKKIKKKLVYNEMNTLFLVWKICQLFLNSTQKLCYFEIINWKICSKY